MKEEELIIKLKYYLHLREQHKASWGMPFRYKLQLDYQKAANELWDFMQQPRTIGESVITRGFFKKQDGTITKYLNIYTLNSYAKMKATYSTPK